MALGVHLPYHSPAIPVVHLGYYGHGSPVDYFTTPPHYGGIIPRGTPQTAAVAATSGSGAAASSGVARAGSVGPVSHPHHYLPYATEVAISEAAVSALRGAPASLSIGPISPPPEHTAVPVPLYGPHSFLPMPAFGYGPFVAPPPQPASLFHGH